MKIIVLDRDGVINLDSEQFIKKPEEWKPIPGSLEAIARLNESGWRVVIASNQSGLGRGLFDMDTLNAINEKMTKALGQVGDFVDEADAQGQHGLEVRIDHRRQRGPQAGTPASCALIASSTPLALTGMGVPGP